MVHVCARLVEVEQSTHPHGEEAEAEGSHLLG